MNQISIHTRIPLKAAVMIVGEAGDHVRKMSGLAVAMEGGGVGGQDMVEANEGTKVVGCDCEGVSRLPRQSRRPPLERTPLDIFIITVVTTYIRSDSRTSKVIAS